MRIAEENGLLPVYYVELFCDSMTKENIYYFLILEIHFLILKNNSLI